MSGSYCRKGKTFAERKPRCRTIDRTWISTAKHKSLHGVVRLEMRASR